SVHKTRFAAADSLRPIESSPVLRTISGDDGVLLPGAEPAARNVKGRRAANTNRPRRVRALGACQTTPCLRRQPHGYPAPQDYPPRARQRAHLAGCLSDLADLGATAWPDHHAACVADGLVSAAPTNVRLSATLNLPGG